MGTLARMVRQECVLLDVDVSAKAEILSCLIQSLYDAGYLSDTELLRRDIMAREAQASTNIGYGCAVPHAHSAALDKSLLAIARLAHPLEADTPDGQPVNLVFLLAGPRDSAGLHLKLLSKLVRLLHDADLRQALLSAADSQAICHLLLEKDT